MGRALGRCYADTNLDADADADGLDAEDCTKNMYREEKDEWKKQLAACGDVRTAFVNLHQMWGASSCNILLASRQVYGRPWIMDQSNNLLAELQ